MRGLKLSLCLVFLSLSVGSPALGLETEDPDKVSSGETSEGPAPSCRSMCEQDGEDPMECEAVCVQVAQNNAEKRCL